MMESILGCKGCSSSCNSVFRTLTAEQNIYLNNHKSIISINKGYILYSEGSRINNVFCVFSGFLKIYKIRSDGKQQIVAFSKKGDIVGYRSVLSNEPACTTAQALEKSEICIIPSQIIFNLLRSNGNFAIALMQFTCKELNQANSIIKDIAQKNIRERLSETLLMLENTFGTNKEGYLKIILTREELSNIIGSATESIIRLLSEFNSMGYISLHGKMIKINDRIHLKKLSKSFH